MDRNRQALNSDPRTEHLKTGFRGDLVIAGWSTCAKHGAQTGRVVNAIHQCALREVNANDFAKHDPARHVLALMIGELDNLGELAFEGHGTGGDTRRIDDARWALFQFRALELVFLGRKRCAAFIHRFREVPRDKVPGEFAGGLNIVEAVLFSGDAGKADNGRGVVEGVEEAVGRKVCDAISA